MKRIYNFERNPEEYVTYSAHLSDYLFTTGENTLFNELPSVQKWNSFNNHGWGERAGFPGFLMLGLSLVGIFSLALPKKQHPLSISAKLGKNEVLFLTMMAIGFVFSLGTRLSFDGKSSPIPNIYFYLIKFVPFLDSIRSTARWSFLFYLGLIWFSIVGLQKIFNRIENKKLKIAAISVVCAIFIVESLPVKMESHSEEYYSGYSKIESLCQNKKLILLELPVTHLDYPDGIINGLDYISKVEMASTLHGCYLYNGYSGFEPDNLASFRSSAVSILDSGDANALISLLRKEKIEILKINDHRWDGQIATLAKSGDLKQIDANVFLVEN